MLSRVTVARKLAPALVANARCSSTQPPVWKREIFEAPNEHPDRDLVNFPRYKRTVHPAPVRMGFIPEEFFQFFYPKTGLYGPYLFAGGLVTTILSKEIMVIEHEFTGGIALFSMLAGIQILYGKDIAAYLDKELDKEDEEDSRGLNEEKQHIAEAIAHEELCQKQTACQSMVFDVKRENVGLQLEAEYRRRQLKVYQEVKKKLDYHLEIINIERRLQQKHMVDWIISNVLKSISPQQEKEALSKCITDLKALAAKA